jgi:hypothetical protein
MFSVKNQPTLKFLLFPAILAFSILLFPLSFTLAQGGDTAIISDIGTDQFPSISFNLAVYNAQGNFIKDIPQEDVRIQENGNLLNADSLSYSEPGLQMVVAVNPGPALGYLADQTVRFEKIRQVLSDWIASRPENALDDYSFVTQEGVVESRLTDPALFQQVLASYQPAFADSKSDLQSLSAALDLALEPNPRPLMHRAILYITPLPTEDQLPGLNDMIARASQLDVKVFVWMVAYPSSADALGAEALRQLAARTGGQFFLFSGVETLPDPETYLLPLRGIYSVTYTSMLHQSGVNTLSVAIQSGSTTITSAPVTFDINILPPNPFLLSPPAEIDRSWTSGRAIAENLSPTSVDLNYLVEFPDGYERNIQTVRLFVDGEQVLAINDPQNGTVTWQLPAEIVTTTHRIQVEVTDTLGLTGRSVEIPIQIVVPAAPKSWLQNLAGYFTGTRVLILFAMVLSAAILVAVVYFSSRSYRLNLARRPARSVYKDPVTQPVHVRSEVRSAATDRDQQAAASTGASVLARMIPLAKGEGTAAAATLNIRHPQELIGSDARQVTLFIDSASISAIHARLILNDAQEFILSDEDSVAGTWVNYAPVSKKGIRLENNDLISFGKTSFRFELPRRKNGDSQKPG